MVEVVYGEGLLPANLMLIGERPGMEECRAGRPFVGPAGRKMDLYLEHATIYRPQCYITNLVKSFRNYFKPSLEEIVEWMPVLIDEIDQCQPAVIALLGTYAVENVISDWKPANLGKRHGRVYKLPCGVQIVPCYHPAAGLYDRSTDIKLQHDFNQVRAALDHRAPTEPLHVPEVENVLLPF